MLESHLTVAAGRVSQCSFEFGQATLKSNGFFAVLGDALLPAMPHLLHSFFLGHIWHGTPTADLRFYKAMRLIEITEGK